MVLPQDPSTDPNCALLGRDRWTYDGDCTVQELMDKLEEKNLFVNSILYGPSRI